MLIGDIGSNLQNPSDDICRIYWADERKELVQVDCAGAEALIVAWECEDARFRQLFKCGIKPHTFVAMHLFQQEWKKETPYDAAYLCKLSLDNIPALAEHPEWRELSKKIKNHHERYFIGKKTCHCLSSDHEVLTKKGWKSIDEMPNEIAIWDKTEKVSFQQISWNQFDFDGELLNLNGDTISQQTTEEHRLITKWGNGWKELTAKELRSYKHNSFRIPSGGFYSGTRKLLREEVQFICAVQADGSYSFNRIQFHFKKDRKIDRLEEILKKLKLNYTLVYSKCDDSYRFSVERPTFIEDFLQDKKFTYKLLELCEDNLETIMHEIFYWDGHVSFPGSNGHYYFSKHYQNVEVLKTIAHLRGRHARINKANGVFKLGLSNRKFSSLQEKQTLKTKYEGKVYCPTTSTGYFLVRHKGQISVTGNSFNYCKTAASFRFDILKESEGKVTLTLPQSELFEGIYHFLFPEIKKMQKETEELIRSTRTLRNLFGHPMHFGTHITDKIIREGVAWKFQSTVGIIGSNGFRDMQRYVETFNKTTWDVLNNKHDSVLVQCPIGEGVECAKVLAGLMGVTLTSSRGDVFKMGTEASVGRNWAKWDEEENPEGMKEIKI